MADLVKKIVAEIEQMVPNKPVTEWKKEFLSLDDEELAQYYVFTSALKKENQVFNRYSNILPNEGTRVKLTTQSSDYINANLIDSDRIYLNLGWDLFLADIDSNSTNVVDDSDKNTDNSPNSALSEQSDSKKEKTTKEPFYVAEKHRYIATQCPFYETVESFWRTIYEQDCCCVAMISGAKDIQSGKMMQYWPTDGKKCVFENNENILSIFPLNDQFFIPEIEKNSKKSKIDEKMEKTFGVMKKSDYSVGQLPNSGENIFSNENIQFTIQPQQKKGFIERKFLIKLFDKKTKRNLPEKTLVSLQFTQWPDFGIPASNLFIEYLKAVFKQIEKSSSKTVLCHCSAGVGRTGVFLSSLILWKFLTDLEKFSEKFKKSFGCAKNQQKIWEKKIEQVEFPILEIVRLLRAHRAGMVQTVDQYVFIFQVFVELAKLLQKESD